MQTSMHELLHSHESRAYIEMWAKIDGINDADINEALTEFLSNDWTHDTGNSGYENPVMSAGVTPLAKSITPWFPLIDPAMSGNKLAEEIVHATSAGAARTEESFQAGMEILKQAYLSGDPQALKSLEAAVVKVRDRLAGDRFNIPLNQGNIARFLAVVAIAVTVNSKRSGTTAPTVTQPAASERIKTVSPGALRMVRVASISKERFSDDVFRAAIGETADTRRKLDLTSLKDELTQAGLLRDGKVVDEEVATAALHGMKPRDVKKLVQNVNKAMEKFG